MLISNQEFVEAHRGHMGDIGIYGQGQEADHTTWRFAKLNLSIRGIYTHVVRYRPGIWGRAREGDHDHLRALVHPCLAIVERVLPVQAATNTVLQQTEVLSDLWTKAAL